MMLVKHYKYQMYQIHNDVCLADKELHWHGPDSEELYQKNLITNLTLLKKYNWVDRKFTYKFNHYGFRADEFNSMDPNVIFLGCSHTQGIGLPIENTFAHIVSTNLGLKNYNLGIGGSSNDTAFRLAYYYIPRLKPTAVIFLSTEKTRFELHTDDNRVENFGPWHNSCDNAIGDFKKHWFSNDVNNKMNYLKNLLAIQQLCFDSNIKFYHHEFLSFLLKDRARDLQHYGVKSHFEIAEAILTKF